MDIRLSYQGLKILAAFLARPTIELSGADLIKETKLRSGTLYPILMRFEEAGLLQSNWETTDPHELGRPRRRLYRVTPTGQRVTPEALEPFIVRSTIVHPA